MTDSYEADRAAQNALRLAQESRSPGPAKATHRSECTEKLPGGMGYEKCVRVNGHDGQHITMHGDTWPETVGQRYARLRTDHP